MERYTDYDPFAELYNRRWGGFAANIVPALDHLVFDRLPPGATVLDLCCGTGQLLASLGDRDLDLIGVDGSAAMIEHARANAPGGHLRRRRRPHLRHRTGRPMPSSPPSTA